MRDSGPMRGAYWVDQSPVARDVFAKSALDPSQSVIIQACAGSGKTWLLVSRLLRILLAGAKPSEILAITFTRKAAGEMKLRLIELLEELACASDRRCSEILVARGLAREEAYGALARARELLELVLDAPRPIAIETFHGWFARVVRSAPLAEGIASGFALTERVGALVTQARQVFLARLDHDEFLRTAYLDLLRRVGEESAWKLMRAMLSRRNDWLSVVANCGMEGALARLAVDLGIDPLAQDRRIQLTQSVSFLTRAAEVTLLLESGSPTEHERAVAALAALEALKEGFDREHFKKVDTLVRLKSGGVRLPTRAAKSAARVLWGQDGEARLEREMNELSDELIAAREYEINRDAYLLNCSTWHCAHAFLEIFGELKRSRASLDFDDLEWLAAALSQDVASAGYIQTRLDARYKHVLVDEFQDTNSLQWATLKSWLEAYGDQATRPSVFLVGDAAQSIYRFRRAEPRLFAQAEEFLRTTFGARVLRTNETRRCAPEIVQVLNGALSNPAYRGFQEHYAHGRQTGEVWCVEAVAPGVNAIVPGPVLLRDALTTPVADPEANRHDVEAAEVARAILRFVGRREIEPSDPGASPRHIASWRDVLVLVRKRATMASFERAFRAHGIPYTSDRSGGLLQTLEALDLSALLKFLVVPFSDLLLAHVLRTPLFGFDEQQLVRLAQGRELGATWWQRLCALRTTAPFERAWQHLSRWVSLAGQLPVHDLLDRIYHEGQVIARYVASAPSGAASGLGSQVRSNLLAYMELALVLDSGRYPSLPRFIEELESLAAAPEQEAPDEGVTDFGDTVRILTIHGAKGLEAPIVVVTDTLSSRSLADSNGVLIDWPPGHATPRHFSVFGLSATRGNAREPWFDEEHNLAEQEDWNLLYVAATRAKEVLILSGVCGARGDKSGTWYERFFQAGARVFEPATNEEPPLRLTESAPAQESGESVLACVPDFQPRPCPIGVRTRALFEEADALDAARQRGIALHRVLETIADTPRQTERALALARDAGLSADAAQDVAATAMRILGASHLSRFFDPGQYQRAAAEVELLLADGQLMRVDRIVEFEDEIWVLDYKSQTSTAGVDAHRAQLARYVSALEASQSGRRVRAAIIFSDGVLTEI